MSIVHYKDGLSLVDYLAIEQELVQHVEERTLFTWIVPPTVIYGRHQCVEAEVNEEYCQAHHIAVVQRKSGGGCVYADEGNLMVSYIVPHQTTSNNLKQLPKTSPYDEFLVMLSRALRTLGYEAVTTAHNDVLVGGRKVAGTACYTTPTGTVVHACMLYDVNLDHLQQAITPSAAKLAKHAVASVRQRVRNLRETHDLGSVEQFRRLLEQAIQSRETS